MAINTETKSLLIIDDDPDDRNLFIAAVKEIDKTIVCVSADNGQQALTMLNNAENLPDFIILDLRMPGYSGKKCLLAMKNDHRLKSIPVFIYTTSKNVEESNELREIGACHFMTKPNNPDEIYYLASYILSEKWVDS